MDRDKNKSKSANSPKTMVNCIALPLQTSTHSLSLSLSVSSPSFYPCWRETKIQSLSANPVGFWVVTQFVFHFKRQSAIYRFTSTLSTNDKGWVQTLHLWLQIFRRQLYFHQRNKKLKAKSLCKKSLNKLRFISSP